MSDKKETKVTKQMKCEICDEEEADMVIKSYNLHEDPPAMEGMRYLCVDCAADLDLDEALLIELADFEKEDTDDDKEIENMTPEELMKEMENLLDD